MSRLSIHSCYHMWTPHTHKAICFTNQHRAFCCLTLTLTLRQLQSKHHSLLYCSTHQIHCTITVTTLILFHFCTQLTPSIHILYTLNLSHIYLKKFSNTKSAKDHFRQTFHTQNVQCSYMPNCRYLQPAIRWLSPSNLSQRISVPDSQLFTSYSTKYYLDRSSIPHHNYHNTQFQNPTSRSKTFHGH